MNAAFLRFPTRKLFVDMPRRLDVPLQWFVGHFPLFGDFVTLSIPLPARMPPRDKWCFFDSSFRLNHEAFQSIARDFDR